MTTPPIGQPLQDRQSQENPGESDPIRCAVVTLVQIQDFPTAWSSLASVEPQLGPDRRRFVLLNDTSQPQILHDLRAQEYTEVVEVGVNLGVAKGRNVLLRRALDWGADLIFTIDDDLLVPCDYLERVVVLMEDSRRSSDAELSVLTPILLDYHAVALALHSPSEIREVENGEVGSFMQGLSTAEVMTSWASLDLLDAVDAVHHMGIRDWDRHYFAPLGRTARHLAAALSEVAVGSLVRPVNKPPTELRSDTEVVGSILHGERSILPIDCAPGGSTVYRRSALEKIGLLEEAFSPFGYEDAELCIRAKQSGFGVGLMPSVALLHDLQSRHKARDPLVATSTRAKARALLIRQHSENPSAAASRVLESLLVGAFESTMYSHVRGGELTALFAFIVGGLSGLFAKTTESPDHSRLWSSAGSSLVRVKRPEIDIAAQTASPGLMPRLLAGSVEFSISTRETLSRSSLPKDLIGRASIAYELNREGDLSIKRLQIAIPTLLNLELKGEMTGLREDGSAENPLDRIHLKSLSATLVDRGFVDAFESSRAWLGGWESEGTFRSLARKLPGREGAAIRSFLAPWQSSRALSFDLTPSQPVGYRDLAELDGGPWHAMRRLGLRVRLRNHLLSSEVHEEGLKH